MITNTFLMLDKLQKRTEQRLWQQGISDWQTFLQTQQIKGISSLKKSHYDRQIMEARKALLSEDASFFANHLPRAEHWRLYDYFKDECVFLDIETSGLGKNAYITVIGLYDGYDTKTMIHGMNLDSHRLKQELSKYQMFITFNGSSFDLPFIERKYPGVLPNLPHLDLKHACARVGMTGGLKEIEKQLGIKRQNKIVEKMYGGDALTLWRMYRASGDDHYLDILISYNEEDVINLKRIAEVACSELKQKTLTQPLNN